MGPRPRTRDRRLLRTHGSQQVLGVLQNGAFTERLRYLILTDANCSARLRDTQRRHHQGISNLVPPAAGGVVTLSLTQCQATKPGATSCRWRGHTVTDTVSGHTVWGSQAKTSGRCTVGFRWRHLWTPAPVRNVLFTRTRLKTAVAIRLAHRRAHKHPQARSQAARSQTATGAVPDTPAPRRERPDGSGSSHRPSGGMALVGHAKGPAHNDRICSQRQGLITKAPHARHRNRSIQTSDRFKRQIDTHFRPTHTSPHALCGAAASPVQRTSNSSQRRRAAHVTTRAVRRCRVPGAAHFEFITTPQGSTRHHALCAALPRLRCNALHHNAAGQQGEATRGSPAPCG